ncbi:Peptidyl-prolyl cis-trans isomerase PIN4 [Diplonema papillatum]|nr:Peptidyl-prolyl cis-trans isomerase PIN4 [Diplonema papillatum]
MGKSKGPAQAEKGGAKKGAKPEEKVVEKGVDSQEVRHILFEKHGQALNILKLINDGTITFNEAARTHSLDKAGRSGLIGWKRKTELDPTFWEAALTVPIGEYTKEPIRTPFGYHIIMVHARK